MSELNLFGKITVSIFVISFLIVTSFAFSVFYKGENTDANEYQTKKVEIGEDYSRKTIAVKIGSELNWSTEEERRFEEAMLGMQWDTFKEDLLEIIGNKLNFNETKKEAFLTHSSNFLSLKPNILENLYIPSVYEFEQNLTSAQIAEVLISRLANSPERLSFIENNISSEALNVLNSYLEGQMKLLPDIVLLPPQDIGLKKENGKTLLVFSTTYYNIGDGDLEIVADSKTSNVPGDVTRAVFQKISRLDGAEESHLIGIFDWHDIHLHYHYEDFIEYRLTDPDSNEEELLKEKSTYCVRDVTRIILDDVVEVEPKFRVCGKERQGVTRGWGDTYFYTYGSQSFDITNIPSGEYKLSFHANPENLFQEITIENNESGALIEINKEEMEVKIIELLPKSFPDYEHIKKKDS